MTRRERSWEMSQRGLARLSAALLTVEALLIFVPLVVLGGAIGWPASLDAPASVNLPLVAENLGGVLFGYFVYLVYSLLFWPLSYWVTRVLAEGGPLGPLLGVASGFGLGSAVLRVLGITRWLYPMPVLAALYGDPAASEGTRETVAILYETLNAYGGAVGEVLGVSLFAALWLTLVSASLLRSSRFPRWLGLLGLLAAAALYAALLELLGLDLGALTTVSVSLLHVWFLAFAFVLFRRGARREEKA